MELKDYLKEKYKHKKVEIKESYDFTTIYINGEINLCDRNLKNHLNKKGYFNFNVSYPEKIIHNDKLYNVNEKYDDKDNIDFFTIHIHK